MRATRTGYVPSNWGTKGSCKVYLVCKSPATIYAPRSATGGMVALRWRASKTSGVQYELQRGLGGSYVTVYTGSSLKATVTALVPGSYTFRVRAIKTGYAPGTWKTSSTCKMK